MGSALQKYLVFASKWLAHANGRFGATLPGLASARQGRTRRILSSLLFSWPMNNKLLRSPGLAGEGAASLMGRRDAGAEESRELDIHKWLGGNDGPGEKESLDVIRGLSGPMQRQEAEIAVEFASAQIVDRLMAEVAKDDMSTRGDYSWFSDPIVWDREAIGGWDLAVMEFDRNRIDSPEHQSPGVWRGIPWLGITGASGGLISLAIGLVTFIALLGYFLPRSLWWGGVLAAIAGAVLVVRWLRTSDRSPRI